MPRSPRRRTAAVVTLALLACLTGMALAVVAFGQSTGDPDATVPLGDFTSTTPARQAQATTPTSGSTTPTSSYTTPTSAYTTPTSTYTTTTPSTHTTTRPTHTSTGTGSPSSPGDSGGSPTTGTPTQSSHLPRTPTAHVSKVTRPGPSQLAFTGGEPLMVGGAGAALMLAAGALQLRRRRAGAVA